MTKDIISRYIWLVDTICQAGSEGITYREISDKWERYERLSQGEPYPWKTFMNHRKEIEEIFGVEIVCRKNNNTYYIPDREELSDASGVKQWLLDTLSINNQVNESMQLKDRILVETNPSSRFLTTILEAMRENKMITFSYKPFWFKDQSKVSNLYHVEPYAVKVFKRRWYLLAKYGDSPLKIYALDRFVDVDIEFDSFEMPEDFCAEQFFSDYYGVFVSEEEATDVVLKVDSFQANYLRTLPLHHSQKEEEKNDDYVVFSYYIHPTYDFYQELLSLGESVEVLAPKEVRTKMNHLGRAIQKHHSPHKRPQCTAHKKCRMEK